MKVFFYLGAFIFIVFLADQLIYRETYILAKEQTDSLDDLDLVWGLPCSSVCSNKLNLTKNKNISI